MKYNVGDTIRCTKTSYGCITFKNILTLGNIYTIKISSYINQGLIGIKNDKGHTSFFYDYEYETYFEPYDMKNDYEIQNYEEWEE